MAETMSFEGEIGRIYFGYVRDFVSELKFKGYRIDHWEGRGWFSRRFIFCGDPIAVRQIARALEQIRQENLRLNAEEKRS